MYALLPGVEGKAPSDEGNPAGDGFPYERQLLWPGAQRRGCP